VDEGKIAPQAILLIVSNPVDVLTYVSLKLSGGPSARVFGSGTVLDTSRFRFLLAKRLNVAAANVHAYMVGEHGDSEVPLWSSVHIAATGLDQFSSPNVPPLTEGDREEIFRNVRDAAAQVNRTAARPKANDMHCMPTIPKPSRIPAAAPKPAPADAPRISGETIGFRNSPW